MPQQPPDHPIFAAATAPPAAAVVVAAQKGRQAGFAIYGAPCPTCHPGGCDNVQEWVWLNKAGRHTCRRCQTPLLLTHADFPEITGG